MNILVTGASRGIGECIAKSLDGNIFAVARNEEKLKAYKNYVNAVFDAYGAVYCRNKYNIPAGTLCNAENEGKSAKLIEQYINDLILQIQKNIFEFDFIKNYN